MSSTSSVGSASAPFHARSLPVSPAVRAEALVFLLTARSGATLYELEGQLRQLLQSVAALLLDVLAEALWERDQRIVRPRCSRCAKPMHINRPEERTLQLLEGDLRLWRNYWECRPCKVRLHPLDLELALPRDGEAAERFGHDLCRLGVELPYRTGAEVLEVLTDRKLDPGTIRNQVLREGQALHDLERKEAELYAAILKPRYLKARLAELPKLRSVPVPTGTLVVELDGVMGNVGADKEVKAKILAWEAREKAAKEENREVAFDEPKPSVYRETLNGRFYRLDDVVRKETKSGKVRSQIMRSETVTVVNDPQLFSKRVYAVAESWQESRRYQAIALLGDGAIFERGLHDVLQPHYEILDYMHAKGHAYECGRALFGENTKEAKGWGKRWSDSLYNEGAEPFLKELQRELQRYREQDEDPPKKLTNLHGYVTRHKKRMRYPTFRDLGLPIASGAIESTNRQVFGDRCKRSGMGWKRSSLQALLSLRAALKSDNWDEACASIRQARSCRTSVEPELPKAASPTEVEVREPWPEELLEAPRRASQRRTSRVGAPAWKLAQRIASGLLQLTDGEITLGRRASG